MAVSSATDVTQLLQRTDNGLLLKASAGSEEELRRVEQVIGSHLERFGRRDELEVSWPA